VPQSDESRECHSWRGFKGLSKEVERWLIRMVSCLFSAEVQGRMRQGKVLMAVRVI